MPEEVMTRAAPTMSIRQMQTFSEWYVLVVWPTGKQQQVNGFQSEAHARGWIDTESKAWIIEAEQGPKWP
ncbi:MAG TPA: hypothetical protein VGI79_04415 [Caulobacteraceae bacterium]|jgi:hypothetical protein